MSRIVEVIRNAADRPIEAIQVVVSIIGFIIAVFIISPFFTPAASPAVAQAFNSVVIGKIFIGILVLAPSMPMILSLFMTRFQTTKWYTRSAFFMFVCFLFLVLLRLVTIGVYPIVWIPTLAISLIMAICWAYWKRNA